jgi:hypothetical protein
MAESKFDRLFQSTPPPAEPSPPVTAPRPARARPQRPEPQRPPATVRASVGRPPGKRSDPAWKQFSVLLKKETQREAAGILRSKDEGTDFSGLVQKLLEVWITRQKT